MSNKQKDDAATTAYLRGFECGQEAAKARIAELEAALKPFAEMVVEPFDDLGGVSKIKIGDLRAARAAYLGEKE